MVERLRMLGLARGAARFFGVLGGVALTWACAAFGLIHGPLVSYGCHPPSKVAKLLIQEFDTALLQYEIDENDRCPTPGDLIKGRYIRASGLVDPWGTVIAYWCHGEDVEIRSAGPDKHFDTADDITKER